MKALQVYGSHIWHISTQICSYILQIFLMLWNLECSVRTGLELVRVKLYLYLCFMSLGLYSADGLLASVSILEVGKKGFSPSSVLSSFRSWSESHRAAQLSSHLWGERLGWVFSKGLWSSVLWSCLRKCSQSKGLITNSSVLIKIIKHFISRIIAI